MNKIQYLGTFLLYQIYVAISNLLLCSPRKLGKKITHFDEHILSNGLVKNHQHPSCRGKSRVPNDVPTFSETIRHRWGPKRDLNIGETRVWRLDSGPEFGSRGSSNGNQRGRRREGAGIYVIGKWWFQMTTGLWLVVKCCVCRLLFGNYIYIHRARCMICTYVYIYALPKPMIVVCVCVCFDVASSCCMLLDLVILDIDSYVVVT